MSPRRRDGRRLGLRVLQGNLVSYPILMTSRPGRDPFRGRSPLFDTRREGSKTSSRSRSPPETPVPVGTTGLPTDLDVCVGSCRRENQNRGAVWVREEEGQGGDARDGKYEVGRAVLEVDQGLGRVQPSDEEHRVHSDRRGV